MLQTMSRRCQVRAPTSVQLIAFAAGEWALPMLLQRITDAPTCILIRAVSAPDPPADAADTVVSKGSRKRKKVQQW